MRKNLTEISSKEICEIKKNLKRTGKQKMKRIITEKIRQSNQTSHTRIPEKNKRYVDEAFLP